MFLIILKSGSRYWTESFVEEGGWLKFASKTKDGALRKVELAKSEVAEIVEIPAESLPEGME